MIPKIIHYCWFGGKKIPEPLQHYINGWQEKCPDWEIKLWNEENFDINSHPFAQKAYEEKKYAFVSDYVRASALYEFGGVYLDTDVEIKHAIDEFLTLEAFSSFEIDSIPFTSAVWGSMPKHSLVKRMLDYYDSKTYSNDEPPNTVTISNLLTRFYGIDPHKDENQVGNDGSNKIHIFSSSYFCLDLPKNYTTHHFIGSWLDKGKKESYKEKVHTVHYTNKILTSDVATDKLFLKELAKKINISSLLNLIRYYIKHKFK
ncbi:MULTISPECIES: glycosyltransferase [unclassified Acinetobacter]|jgi:mannosyltransferase OCH1-like enzyme|uniref:glycosyltransferase family 32 protein n=1 Tax=unclassified Acinetobacter TaxID=196816 RepID=UPI001F4A0C9A|nr:MULTISPECIES: glycosyltransferase [unclassified Acinetobacter]MCH7350429.1 glycosyl transferase [Acinetobacter sp. NIPH 2023]MCH7357931.1 glycosyl transferase [Acinetobacter sp. NIPH 2024]